MGPSFRWILNQKNRLLAAQFPQVDQLYLDPERLMKDKEWPISAVKSVKDRMSKQEFETCLNLIDKQYRAPIPTGQNAKQAGEYLSTKLNLVSGSDDEDDSRL